MLPEYKYQCNDQAILLPPLKKWIVNPLINFIPWGIPANIMTIISNLFLYASLYMSFTITEATRYYFILAGLFIFIYLVGDHLDGAQAKRTSTGSALGEFFDHYLDAFNNGILLIIMINFYKISNIYLISIIFAISYLSHSSVIYEQYKTKWLNFEKISSLEAIILESILIMCSYSASVYNFFKIPFIANLNIIEIILIGIMGGAVCTLIRVGIRIRNFSLKFYIHIIFTIILSVYSINFLSKNEIFLLITLYNCIYIGFLMKGHLVGCKEHIADFFLPLIFLIHLVFQNEFSFLKPFLKYISLYLSAWILYIIATTFYPLRSYWYWKNPRNS